MSHLSCCGMQFANKFSLRRHTNTKHRTATPILRCYVEDCLRRFKTSATLKIHQKEHLWASNAFYLKSHAFNGTTLVLRRDLLEQGLHDFDFISSTDGIEEIKRIINSEVVKKNALSFSTAVTINFVKYGVDGEITERDSPCSFIQTKLCE